MRVELYALSLVATLGCGRVRFQELPGDGEAAIDGAPIGADGATARRRNRIDVHGALVAEDLSGFPVPVALRGPAFDRAQARPDGADLRVFAADQVTPLPFELERFDATGAELWIRVPAITAGADSTVWITYGDPSPPAALPSADVWPTSEYVAVWHLVDARDATANGLDGVFGGTADAAGVFGRGRDVQRGYMEVADAPALAAIGATGEVTWSAWARTTALPYQFSALIDRRLETTDRDDFRFGPVDTGGLSGQLTTDPGQADVPVDTGGGLVALDGGWHLYAMIVGRGELRLNLDGAPQAATAAPGAVHVSANPVWLGAGCNGCIGGVPDGDIMEGTLDEVRIEAVMRSPGWLAAQHRALTGGLVTVQPFE